MIILRINKEWNNLLIENTLFGENNKVKKAIDRLQAFEPVEGYYLAFSGGKDSQCIYHLAIEAGVKFETHYNITGIDPPELIYFMTEHYPNVIKHQYKKSIFKLIETRGLPTRLSRFCCDVLKEHGGEDRICVTGVRWAESSKRKSRKPFEIVTKNVKNKKLFSDNDEDRRLFENCMQKGKRVINPIIDWDDEDVWEYLNSRNIPHCKLYDQGCKRIGCIGCPLSGNQKQELEDNPIFKANYKRAIERFLPKYLKRCKDKNRKPYLDNVEDWYSWWIGETIKGKNIEGQINVFEDMS